MDMVVFMVKIRSKAEYGSMESSFNKTFEHK
jgi:hypothetical protein